MKAFRLACFFLLMLGLLAISLPGLALAQEAEQPAEEFVPPPESIELAATYPKLETVAGGAFNFEVGFRFAGDQPRNFDLTASVPAGWQVYITPQFEKDKKISAIP